MLTVTKHLAESSAFCLSDSILAGKAVNFLDVLQVFSSESKDQNTGRFSKICFLLHAVVSRTGCSRTNRGPAIGQSCWDDLSQHLTRWASCTGPCLHRRSHALYSSTFLSTFPFGFLHKLFFLIFRSPSQS